MAAPVGRRSIEDVHAGFWAVHREAGTLHTQALRLQPSLKLAWKRARLVTLEIRLGALYTEFLNLEADLVAHAGQVPADLNSKMAHNAWFGSLFGVRDSVRGVLGDTSATLNGTAARLESLKALWFSVASIVLALGGIAASIA